MRYTTEVTINLPRERVIELFDDVDNLKKWQPGLQSFEHISGEPGQPGAKSRLVYDMNGRKIEMIETITSRNLPDEFSGTYDAKGVHNVMVNRFYADSPDRTRWVTESEFQFGGFMRLLGLFMRGSFPKQTRKTMEDFKRFAESA
jgi:carbon monoxide dehydrogenase subunit G